MTANKLKDKIKNILLETINFTLIVIVCIGLMIILWLHKLVPFFPVLFLFHIFFWVVHPLFLKYVYKEKWHFFTSDSYRLLKYVLIPCIVFEVAVIMYYPKESIMAAKQIGAEESVDK